MKVSDICVGDWLNIYTFPNDNPKQDDLFPAKVSAVSVFDPFKDPDDVTVELVIPNTNGLASRPLDTCLPIELTEEILVKNGFERCDYNYKYFIIDDAINLITPKWRGGTEYYACAWYQDEFDDLVQHIEICKCAYVHQLQRLLNLCNIDKEIIL